MEVSTFTLADLRVGQTERITVDVEHDHIDRFLELSGDHSPIHADETFAQKQGFEGRIAHGLLIGSFISRLIGNRLPGCYGIMQSFKIDFRKPLVPPETIGIVGEITNISVSTGQIRIKVNVVDSTGILIASAQVKTIVKDH